METSWASQLIGRSVQAVEPWKGCPCVVGFTGGYRLQIEALWRLVSSNTLVLTSRDDGQFFGGSRPINGISELSSRLLGLTLDDCQVAQGTGDLTLNFGQAVLQVVTDSSGYEAWQVEGPAGTVAVCQGGGNVVVWG